MGNCFGIDQPMMTIGIKTIRASKFKEIKTRSYTTNDPIRHEVY